MTPLEILGLHEDASSQEIGDRWRTLRSELHPDRGGDAGEFDAAKKAYEQAHAEAVARESTCKTCGGSGSIDVTRGFNRLSMSCPTCK